MVWALRNPEAGVVEPDDLDHELVLAIASPYLGDSFGARQSYLQSARCARHLA